jgi:hypothetical protein
MRSMAGMDFSRDFVDDWPWSPDEGPNDWRQRVWENAMLCQGLEGFHMIMPHSRRQWVDRVREWRDKTAALTEQPKSKRSDPEHKPTLEYPFLLGDLAAANSHADV